MLEINLNPQWLARRQRVCILNLEGTVHVLLQGLSQRWEGAANQARAWRRELWIIAASQRRPWNKLEPWNGGTIITHAAPHYAAQQRCEAEGEQTRIVAPFTREPL